MRVYIILFITLTMFSCKGIIKNIEAKNNKDKEESFYLNGQAQFSYPLVNGKRNGMATAYYEDGTIWATHEWKDDKLHGKSKSYIPNGELAKEEIWSDGRLMEEKIYWQDAGKDGYLFVSKDGFYTMKDGKKIKLDETTPNNVIEEVYKQDLGMVYFIWKNGKREPLE